MHIPTIILAAGFFGAVSFPALSQGADVKKLLVVTTTAAYRHDTIPLAETVLEQLAERSHAFTLDYIHQPTGRPTAPKKPLALKDQATPDERQSFDSATEKYLAADAVYQIAQAHWTESLKEAACKTKPGITRRLRWRHLRQHQR